MFSASRLLLFAKTAVKETAAPKKRAAPGASAKKVKAAAKVRDPSLPPPSSAFTLPQLIEKIPAPAPGTPPTEWQHKGGWGLKFYRKQWAKYPEPSYWTVTRYKPSTHGHKRKVWGVLTWRGVTEERPREVVGIRKPEWKYLKEGDFVIPLSTPRSLARAANPRQPDAPAQPPEPSTAQEEGTVQTVTATA